MKKYGTIIGLEWLKIKDRRFELKAVIAGGILPLLQFIFSFSPPQYIIQNEVSSSVIEDYIFKTICCFVLYVLSIYIIMTSRSIMSAYDTYTIAAQNNYNLRDNTSLFIQNHSPGSLSVYLSKYILLQMMVFLSITTYFISGIIFSVMDIYVHRAGEMFLFFDPILILTVFFKLNIAMMGIAAFQLLVSTVSGRWLWQIFLGSLGIMITLYSMGSETQVPYVPYHTIYFLRSISSIRALSHLISFSEYLNLLWTLFLLMTGYLFYRQKGR